MANGNVNTRVQIGQGLRQLLEQIPGGLQGLGQGVLDFVAKTGPLPSTAQIAGAASVKPSEDLLTEATKKALVKLRTDQVNEAAAAGVPLENIAQQTGLIGQTGQPSATGTDETVNNELTKTLVGEETLEREIPQQNPLQQLANFLFQPAGVTPEGEATPSTLLGGLIREPSSSVLQRQQAQALTPRAKARESATEVQFDLIKENFKQDRLDERERIKAGIAGDSPQKAAELFQNDFLNLVNSFEKIGIRGRGRGALSALGVALGIGREERAEFRAASEVFAFSAAEFIGKQTGRALSDKDLQRFEKLGKFKIGGGEQQFMGQVQAIINLSNNRLKQAGKPTLPNAKTLVRQIRAGKDPFTGGNVQTQQGTIKATNIKSVVPVKE